MENQDKPKKEYPIILLRFGRGRTATGQRPIELKGVYFKYPALNIERWSVANSKIPRCRETHFFKWGNGVHAICILLVRAALLRFMDNELFKWTDLAQGPEHGSLAGAIRGAFVNPRKWIFTIFGCDPRYKKFKPAITNLFYTHISRKRGSLVWHSLHFWIMPPSRIRIYFGKRELKSKADIEKLAYKLESTWQVDERQASRRRKVA